MINEHFIENALYVLYVTLIRVWNFLSFFIHLNITRKWNSRHHKNFILINNYEYGILNVNAIASTLSFNL